MNRTYIAIIFILVLALIFAFQNTEPISIKFLAWHINGSQALIILSIFFLGYLGGWLLGMSSYWRKNRELRTFKKQAVNVDPTGMSAQSDTAQPN